MGGPGGARVCQLCLCHEAGRPGNAARVEIFRIASRAGECYTPLALAARPTMKITVLGLSRLGGVVAAGCSRYFAVAGLDEDAAVIDGLRAGRAPFPEPGLDDLQTTNRAARRLEFTTNTILACRDADVLWVTDDRDCTLVLPRLRAVLPNLSPGMLVLISAPLPVGSCAALEREFPQFHFACSPQDLPPGSALEAFENAAQVTVGLRSAAKEALLESLFAPFTQHVVFVATESAEAAVSMDSAGGKRDVPHP
jgi:UDPglucose 6-dehydrogenase